MKRLLILVLFLAFLTACAAAPTVEPDATLTPTDIPATATPEPTPTPTVEPTRNPAQIAADLEGLNQERTYIIIGDYLVDTFNDASKAVLQEDGTWRELDRNNPAELELMYGHLALIEPKIPYVDAEAVVEGNESLYQGDKNFKMFRFYPVWTGNTEERVMNFEDRKIRDLAVEVVFRDTRNTLFWALISYNSPDLEGDAFIQWVDKEAQTTDYFVGSPEELLKKFVPGQQIEEYFITDRPDYATPPQGSYCGYENSLCVEEYRKNIYIYNSEAVILKKFAQELQEGVVDESMNGIVLTGTYMGDLIFMIDSKP